PEGAAWYGPPGHRPRKAVAREGAGEHARLDLAVGFVGRAQPIELARHDRPQDHIALVVRHPAYACVGLIGTTVGVRARDETRRVPGPRLPGQKCCRRTTPRSRRAGIRPAEGDARVRGSDGWERPRLPPA